MGEFVIIRVNFNEYYVYLVSIVNSLSYFPLILFKLSLQIFTFTKTI
jgi:hypothetical protein